MKGKSLISIPDLFLSSTASNGVLIGILIGAAGVAVVSIAIVFFILFRRRIQKKKLRDTESDAAVDLPSVYAPITRNSLLLEKEFPQDKVIDFSAFEFKRKIGAGQFGEVIPMTLSWTN